MCKFERLWRNKWLADEAKTFEELIEAVQRAVDELRAMQQAGVVADMSGAPDDHVLLSTDDPDVAKQFGLEEDINDDEVEGDDWE